MNVTYALTVATILLAAYTCCWYVCKLVDRVLGIRR